MVRQSFDKLTSWRLSGAKTGLTMNGNMLLLAMS